MTRPRAIGGNKSPLMKSISGIRGIVGSTMTPDLVARVGVAFATYVKCGTVVLGRDSRPSGEPISSGLSSALMMAGCDVIDIGVVPTPTVQVMVEELSAAGGIVVSASHNPIEWNAFKLIGSDGTFLNSRQITTFFSRLDTGGKPVPWDRIGGICRDMSAHERHLGRVLAQIDVRVIRKKGYRVVLDAVNGAGSWITVELLERLGCEVIPLNCDGNGIFTRGAEPLPENLAALSAAVKRHHADIGFAQDPDADRLAIVDEQGIPLGEEYTITLVTDHILSSSIGPVVVNLSTTRAVEDVARNYGAPFYRSLVGEINVVDLMRKKKAIIGGEGNGGVISPAVHLGRDSLAGIGYILEMMARRKLSMSSLKASMPHYVMKKGKIPLHDAGATAALLERIQKDFSGERIDKRDGVRIDFRENHVFSGGSVHLRGSNTEPVFRIITEGRDVKTADNLYRYFAGIIQGKK